MCKPTQNGKTKTRRGEVICLSGDLRRLCTRLILPVQSLELTKPGIFMWLREIYASGWDFSCGSWQMPLQPWRRSPASKASQSSWICQLNEVPEDVAKQNKWQRHIIIPTLHWDNWWARTEVEDMNDTASTRAGKWCRTAQHYFLLPLEGKAHTENKSPSVSATCPLGAISGVMWKQRHKVVRVEEKARSTNQCKRSILSSTGTQRAAVKSGGLTERHWFGAEQASDDRSYWGLLRVRMRAATESGTNSRKHTGNYLKYINPCSSSLLLCSLVLPSTVLKPPTTNAVPLGRCQPQQHSSGQSSPSPRRLTKRELSCHGSLRLWQIWAWLFCHTQTHSGPIPRSRLFKGVL